MRKVLFLNIDGLVWVQLKDVGQGPRSLSLPSMGISIGSSHQCIG